MRPAPACPYCRRAQETPGGTCPSCGADLARGPARRGFAGLAGLALAYGWIAWCLWAWGYRPTGWLHQSVDPFVRGAGAESRAEPPFSGRLGADILVQVVVPVLPLVYFGARAAARRRGTRRPVGG